MKNKYVEKRKVWLTNFYAIIEPLNCFKSALPHLSIKPCFELSHLDRSLFSCFGFWLPYQGRYWLSYLNSFWLFNFGNYRSFCYNDFWLPYRFFWFLFINKFLLFCSY